MYNDTIKKEVNKIKIILYHCPVNGWDCPYYIDSQDFDGEPEYCLCGMGFDGLNPYEECGDFYVMYGDDCDPDDYTDYTD